MLGESFIHVYNYRNEKISTSDTSGSLNPLNDQLQAYDSLSQREDVPASLKSTKSWCEPRASQCQRDLYHVSTTPYANLSQSNEPYTSCLNLRLRSIPESQQIHLHTSDPPVPNQSRSQGLRVLAPDEPVLIPDDGYLVMDSSITLNGEPPTNSMLNGYLDRKFQEVYSQYLQERLACPGSSPGSSLLPPYQPPSLLQISHLLNVDSSLELEHRQSQGGVSQRSSSHFSSPILRISNAEPPARPWNPRNPGNTD